MLDTRRTTQTNWILSLSLALVLVAPTGWFGLVSSGVAAPRSSPPSSRSAPPPLQVGFNVGGMDWRRVELDGVTDPAEIRRRRELIAYEEAKMVHDLGGNRIRLFYVDFSFMGTHKRDLFKVGDHPGTGLFRPVYMHTIEERMEKLDKIDAVLDALLVNVPKGLNEHGQPLLTEALDGYLAGVERFNAEQGDAGNVGVLLTYVCRPPRWILEAPSDATLGWYKKPYTFNSLWDKHIKVEIAFARWMIQRYVTRCREMRGQSSPSAVVAFSVGNEPDYDWLPDEHRIEWSYKPDSNALGKYITELHLPQIPDGVAPMMSFEKTGWGHQSQDAQWRDQFVRVPLKDFGWGAKFEWYVKCWADLHEHVTFAMRNEATSASRPITIVSGEVTHNNIDFFIRMHALNPRTFDHVDAMGVHPYHWPQHNILDTRFRSDKPTSDWVNATPREFARDYFKRFDFVEELGRLTRMTDPVESHGMAGKRIWMTEFGFPTKKMGEHNAAVAQWTVFIRERGEPEISGGAGQGVWEDLWDAFFAQVGRDFFERNNVDAFFFYALRESGFKGYDLDDDDRSNFALLKHDGESRMESSTRQRMLDWIATMREQPTK